MERFLRPLGRSLSRTSAWQCLAAGTVRPVGFLLEGAPVLRREHQPCGERCPSSSRYTLASEAQRSGHESVDVANWTPKSGGLPGVLTGRATKTQTDQETRSNLLKTTQQVSHRTMMGLSTTPNPGHITMSHAALSDPVLSRDFRHTWSPQPLP